MPIKGLATKSEELDGSDLRVLVVHARWNMSIIEPLVKGAVEALNATGVKDDNIVIEDVSGSFELPLACSRLIAASQIQASAEAVDLMGAASLLDEPAAPSASQTLKKSRKRLTGPFNAVIAVGCLIKGSTMHFEYICDAVSHGLMRVQLDTGVPVIFGVLTCLTDDQAVERSGGTVNGKQGHNHGIDWGNAAVEQAVKCKRWAQGDV